MDDIVPFEIVTDKMQSIIKVIGVGGGGCNAVRHMYQEGVEGVSFAAFNTDSQALSACDVPIKLMLGEGLGAGGKPEVGRSEAEKSIEDIKKQLNEGIKMVFVTASMGGGTGTGAAPVVASVAKEMGLLTIGVVTIPFFFEKHKTILKALKGVDELRQHVDALLVINNERICDVYADADIPLKEAFFRADNILKDAVKGISDLITTHSDGDINLDFRDVETTMREGGGAIMAMGRASGDHRVEKAIIDALDSPLQQGNDIGKAEKILFNIYTSDEKPILVRELSEINEFFSQLESDINVIFGTSTDNSLGEDARVTILATGKDMRTYDFENAQQVGNDENYEQLISKLYRPIKQPLEEPLPEPEYRVQVPPDPEPVTLPQDEESTPTEATKSERAKLKDRLIDWMNEFLDADE